MNTHAPKYSLPIALFVFILSTLALFALFGNSHLPEKYGPSVLSWMILQWLDPGNDSDYSWFVLPVSIYLLWRKRRELLSAAKSSDNRAMIIIFFCLALYWAGFRAQQPRLGLLSLVGLAWSIPFYLWGLNVARIIMFPCAFALFIIPLGFLTAFTFPLRLFSSIAAAWLLNGLGIATIRDGTMILSSNPGVFALDIADPCSGLQSLTVLTAITAVYANITQHGPVRQWLLFLSAAPLAIAGNIARIISITLFATLLGQETAMKVSHYASGIIVFTTAILLMTILGNLLNKTRGSARHED